jgi:hypothetical protein
MSEPNPWSREGADQPAAAPQQPPPTTDGAGTWPEYPPAPSSSGYEPTGAGSSASGYPAPSPYPYSGSGVSPYGTSPYGPGATGPYPYAAAPYGYTATMHPQAVVSLVLGVIGLVICSPAGVAGLIVARKARKEILAQPDRYSGLGLATAGLVLGIISAVLAALLVLFVVIGLAGGWDQ